MEKCFILLTLVFMQHGKSQRIKRTAAGNVSAAETQIEEFPCHDYYRYEAAYRQKEFKVKMMRINQHPRLSAAISYKKRGCAFGPSYVYCITETSCYKIVRTPLTWVQAKDNCQRLAANLVSIETAREQVRLQVLLDHVFYSLDELKYERRSNFWTGGNDLQTEGDWRWVAGNRHFAYKSWKRDQPDNHWDGEDCLHLLKEHMWRWNDIPCGHKIASICELTC